MSKCKYCESESYKLIGKMPTTNEVYINNGTINAFCGWCGCSTVVKIKYCPMCGRKLVEKMTDREKSVLQMLSDYETITRTDINEFRIQRRGESFTLYTNPQGSSGREHPKGYKGLLGELKKGKKYNIKELLNND